MNRFLAGLIALTAIWGTQGLPAQVLGKPIPEFDVPEGRESNAKKKHYAFTDRYQGRVVLCYFWRTSSLECTEGFKQLADLAKKYHSKGLRIVSFCADSSERFDAAIKAISTNVDFADKFFGTGALKVQEDYFGAMSQPEVALLDPRAVLVWRGSLRDGLDAAVADLIERTKPAAGNEEEQKRRLRLAEKYASQGEYGKAYTVAMRLQKVTETDNQTQGKARGISEKAIESASKWLKDGLEAEKSDNVEKAARIVAEISVRFGGKDDEGKTLDVAKEADNEIGRMNGDRKYKEPIRDAIDNAKGEFQFDLADEYEQQGWFDEAVETYTKITEDFKKTKAAKAAQEALARIAGDKAIQARIAEGRLDENARRWLEMGNRFAAAQLYTQAREQYERVLKDAPKSTVIQKAKEALGKLPKEAADATPAKPAGAKAASGKP